MANHMVPPDRVFAHALNTVKRIPRTGSARPPPSDRLTLYGLYKQSMEGDVDGVMIRPEGNGPDDEAEREKWDAWSAQHGMSRTEAKRRYISTLIETMHKYASATEEARELVAELEFVWDQIKSNEVSSEGSSPGRGTGMGTGQGKESQIYASIGSGRAERRDRGDMRLLRPVSEGDDQEEEEDEIFEEAKDGTFGGDAETGVGKNTERARRENDVRNRKWRKRMEQALVRLNTEVAALREQMEIKRVIDARRRNNLWAWFAWLVWAVVRHVVVDATVLGLMLWWARRKQDRRLEQGLSLLMQTLAEQVKRLGLPQIPRLPRLSHPG